MEPEPLGEHGMDREDETSRSGETNRDVGDAVVAYWTGLDRGWQALWLGLAVVAAHLLVQPFL